ncbi:MAG: 23S rRNA (adenine(2030)-N(6))-methyltransferase RlmJ [Burkholderiaceae bacterium]|nr:23S rRNA (adenine(2030)-N(6))-methyltransferase RlmJ [Burkholderiaceae bacterium]
MFSYRHAFHAGNHADVLKHITLIATLRHLMLKPAALTLVDTHAGAGLYRLDGDWSTKSGEATDGIVKLMAALRPKDGSVPASGIAAALDDYLTVVAKFNPAADGDGATSVRQRVYPGSPFIIQHLMRAASRDRLKLFELHPADSKTLSTHIARLRSGREIAVLRQDGFEALRALLPPPPSASGSRRAMVLMDPSYEIKSDYAKVGACMQESLRRFPNGTYLVWYPIIARAEAHDLPRRLRTLSKQAARGWLHASLNIGQSPELAPRSDRQQGGGLSASGVFVINPPHTLAASLQAALPVLLDILGRGRGKAQSLEYAPA